MADWLTQISVPEDLATVQVGRGVAAGHVVTTRHLARVMTLEADAQYALPSSSATHLLWVEEGELTVTMGQREVRIGPGAVVVLEQEHLSVVLLGSKPSRCWLVTSPPDHETIRALLEAEHEGHGFD
jgi:mannose-6-phosphate isomerase-like protein (cupin superfamily)